MDFKSKYLKYKEKYLNLKKNQMGGNAEQHSAAPSAGSASAVPAAGPALGAAAAAGPGPAAALVIPPRGDFSFIPEGGMNERGMLHDAFTAVESVSGGWAGLIPEPEAGRGFMFSSPPEGSVRAQINTALMATPSGRDHSGSSYGWTMRQMQGIARLGWPAYVTLRLNAMAARAAAPAAHAPHYGHAAAPAAAAGPVVGAVAVFSVRDGQDTICPICFDPLQLAAGNVFVVSDATQDGTVAHPVTCGHKFHRDCIRNWTTKHNTCPMCRGIVRNMSPSSRM